MEQHGLIRSVFSTYQRVGAQKQSRNKILSIIAISSSTSYSDIMIIMKLSIQKITWMSSLFERRPVSDYLLKVYA